MIPDAIWVETAEGNSDIDLLAEAVKVMRNLLSVAQLRVFRAGVGKGPTEKFEWHDLVPEDVGKGIP